MSRNEIDKLLDSIYYSKSNEIVILYGSRYVGINSYIKSFLANKKFVYYQARSLESGLQLNLIADEIFEKIRNNISGKRDLKSAITIFASENADKKILVINDCSKLFKDNRTFINLLISSIREDCSDGSIMIVLATDDVYFVENALPSLFGKALFEINRIIKLDYLSPIEIRKNHRNMSFNDFISFYSIIGGNSDLWDIVDNYDSPKSFICDYLLSYLVNRTDGGYNILPSDLREKSVYNSILHTLVNDFVKLNDIHSYTGYDRAKISVYLKNLMQRGIVNKAQSIEICDSKYIKKGIYSITDNFIRFWYKYIFSNLSSCLIMAPDKFFKKYIEPSFDIFRERAYVEVCLDYLNSGKISNNNSQFGLFHDKEDSIDIAGISDNGSISICACRFSNPHMSFGKLENLINTANHSNIDYENIFLISAVDFDQKIHLYSSVHEEIKLISLDN